MGGGHKLDGWDTYPENLKYLQACDINGYNFPSYGQQLREDSERLFVAPKDGISVKIIELTESHKDGTSHSTLNTVHKADISLQQ